MAANVARDGSGGRASSSRSRSRGGSFGAPKTASRSRTKGSSFGTPKPKIAPVRNAGNPKPAPVASPIRNTKPPVTRPVTKPAQGAMRATAAQGAMRSTGGGGGYSGGQIDTNATGQYSGTMGSFGMDAGMPQEVAAPEPPPQKRLADLTQEEKDAIYNSDTQFTGESSALEQARLALMADLDNQEAEYNRGYTRNLSDIGWLGEGKGTNGWDQDNLQTAYGSSYHGDLNDFAGRGMLNSTAYLQALSRMNDDFKNQVGELGQAKNAFMTDSAAQRSTGQNTYNANLDEARRQALYRAALSNGWAV